MNDTIYMGGGGDKDIVKQFFVVSDVIRMGTVPIQNDITDDKKKLSPMTQRHCRSLRTKPNIYTHVPF